MALICVDLFQSRINSYEYSLYNVIIHIPIRENVDSLFLSFTERMNFRSGIKC